MGLLDSAMAGNLAAGLGGAYQGYNEGQDRAMKRKAQEDEAAYRRQMLDLQRAEKGLIVNPDTGGLILSPDAQEAKTLERDLKSAQVSNLKNKEDLDRGELQGRYGIIGKPDPITGAFPREKGFISSDERQLRAISQRERMTEDREARKELSNRNKLSVPGFQMEENAPLSTDNQKELLKASTAQKRTDQLIGKMAALVDKSGGGKIIPSAEKKQMKQVYEDLKVELKEAANLGALAGADVKILEGQMIDPTSIEANTLYSKEDILNNYQSLRENLRSKLAATAEARGYRPIGDSAGLIQANKKAGGGGLIQEAQATMSPQDQEAMQWAQSNPQDPRAKAIMQRLGGR